MAAIDETSYQAWLNRHGPGYERGLQFLCGGVLFALLMTLGDVWGLEGYRLKVAVKNALIEFSGALLGISLATGIRLLLPGIVATGLRRMLVGAWWLLAVAAMGVAVYGAYHLLNGLQAQISNIQSGQHEALPAPAQRANQHYLDDMRRCLELRKLRAELGEAETIPGWQRASYICNVVLPNRPMAPWEPDTAVPPPTPR